MNNTIIGLIGIVLFAFMVGTFLTEQQERREMQDIFLPPHDEVDVPTVLPGSTWVWEGTMYADNSDILPKSDAFKITFSPDGHFSAITDCNSLSGGYVVDGEVLSVGQIGMTKMYCEGSLDGQFAQDIALASSYTIFETTLTILLNRDYGVMYFQLVQ